MNATQYNRPINSREFKLMLDTTAFINRNEGIKKLSDILQFQLKNQNGEFEENDIEEKNRLTRYLDTSRYDLNAEKFLFRVREEKETNEYNVTLKCRHPDRYVSALYDLSSSMKNMKTKFEEDIITPFVSKFSLSAEFQDKREPKFDTIEEFRTLFPKLNGLDKVPSTESLKKVNNFEAVEISCKFGKIVFENKKDVNAYLNLWYISNEKKVPVIVEFTYNYSAKDPDSDSNGILLEEFPRSLVKEGDKLYLALQEHRIVDLDVAKTKTEYAYQYKKQ
jgi:hypothetical protein